MTRNHREGTNSSSHQTALSHLSEGFEGFEGFEEFESPCDCFECNVISMLSMIMYEISDLKSWVVGNDLEIFE